MSATGQKETSRTKFCMSASPTESRRNPASLATTLCHSGCDVAFLFVQEISQQVLEIWDDRIPN